MFDIYEIDMLMEALTVWWQDTLKNTFVENIMGLLTTDMDKVEYTQKCHLEMDEARERTKAREEQATLLKAKLIMMKQKLMAQEAADYATGKAKDEEFPFK